MLRTDALVARGVVKGRSTPINDQLDLPNFQITKRSVRVLLLARKALPGKEVIALPRLANPSQSNNVPTDPKTEPRMFWRLAAELGLWSPWRDLFGMPTLNKLAICFVA